MIANANALALPFADGIAQMCVTSPPYFGLRDYGTATWVGGDAGCDHVDPSGPINAPSKNSTLTTNNGRGPKAGDKYHHEQTVQYARLCRKCGARRIDQQIGLEPTPAAYVANIVAASREVWRVLRDDGVYFLNLGDSYASQPSWGRGGGSTLDGRKQGSEGGASSDRAAWGLKPKDLCGIPWRVAFALQDDGWTLRSDIVWHKLNPMPESVTDRPTKAHEYVFLLTKNGGKPLLWRARDTREWSYAPDLSQTLADDTPRWRGFDYYYDADAIAEPSIYAGKTITLGDKSLSRGQAHGVGISPHGNGNAKSVVVTDTRNARSVWTIATQPYSGAMSLADYEGDDGRPYIASPDCPLHGHLASSRKTYTAGYGEQPTRQLSHTPDTFAGRVQSHDDEQTATTSRMKSASDDESSLLQNPESTDENRTSSHRHADTLLAQNPSRTDGIDTQDEGMNRKKNSPRREYGLSAIVHSTRKNKTGRALRSSQRDNASAQTSFDIPNMSSSGEHSGSVGRTSENSISEGSAVDEMEIGLSGQMRSRIASIAVFSRKEFYCTCKQVSIDHFATFPEELARRCILAGSRPGDIVLDPFSGSGTAARVAIEHGRRFIGTELSREYIGLAHKRTTVTMGMQFSAEAVTA